ncbi:hypothetical protein SAMN05428969_1564 [Devosia sp. YR412]|uniref:hypothetical protein n=1 Tax=Devosia sp. YR412 TaxID=1881030 RepID=UPI0008C2172B|nr:hypothetical protein [Devosia sp. YR412]SEQ01901.1 hypothetical protein SAMN05428969_1564 [Devosia sp. YR412]
MPAHHVGNAPRFKTLAAERNYYLCCAAGSGQLRVDLKHYAPSNLGMVAQLIKRGFLGKKRGASVPLTDKGRAYLKRHGLGAYMTMVVKDLSMLDERETDVRAMLVLALQSSSVLRPKEMITDQLRALMARGLIEKIRDERRFDYQMRPTAAGMAILAAAGDKMIRAIIAKTDERYLRQNYQGFTALMAMPLDRET